MSSENQSSRATDSRARKAAQAVGYVARKSAHRPNSYENQGGFMVVDPMTNIPLAGFQYDLSAEAVIAWSTEPA